MKAWLRKVSAALMFTQSAEQDLPMPMKPLAGLLLAVACVLGIAATGSIFELAYGDPDLGVSTTRLILGLSLPGSALALLLAIRINQPA